MSYWKAAYGEGVSSDDDLFDFVRAAKIAHNQVIARQRKSIAPRHGVAPALHDRLRHQVAVARQLQARPIAE